MSKKPTRMELLGNLLTAMIAIIVSGSSDLLIEATPITSTNPAFATLNLRECRWGGKYYGLANRVAARLGVCHSNVRRVLYGEATSARVTKALLEEIKIFQSQPLNLARPILSKDEQKQCSHGGKYYGIYTKVARDLGITNTSVRYAAIGKIASDRAVEAMRAEMARIDAKRAAMKVGR